MKVSRNLTPSGTPNIEVSLAPLLKERGCTIFKVRRLSWGEVEKCRNEILVIQRGSY